MTARLATIIFTLAPLSTATDPRISKALLVFVDVTGSLTDAERLSVTDITERILTRVTTGMKYAVYPIDPDPGRAKAIIAEIVSGKQTPKQRAEGLLRREQVVRAGIEALYREVNGPVGQQPRPVERTCILNTLIVANDFFKTMTTTDKEIIYVSDMLENCRVTPINRARISLEKPDIKDELALASKYYPSDSLRGIRVRIILPELDRTAKPRPRPEVADLRQFWTAIFDHAGSNIFTWSVGALP